MPDACICVYVYINNPTSYMDAKSYTEEKDDHKNILIYSAFEIKHFLNMTIISRNRLMIKIKFACILFKI